MNTPDKALRLMASLAALVLLFAVLPALAEPADAIGAVSAIGAADADRKTVRMGFFEFGGMFEGAADGKAKSGYCYEYMTQVAIYTGWTYEYCYGTYAELYEKLRTGEIDILPYTNYNEQRGREVLFADKILAEEEYYIAAMPDRLTGQSLPAGAVISTLEGADYNGLLLDYIAENGMDVRVSYYPDLQDTWDAVTRGDADAAVFTSNAYNTSGWSRLYAFGRKPTYIAVAADRPDLLAELNEATTLIDIDQPALLGELYAVYFSDNPMRRSLSAEESDWLGRHPVLHVGAFSNDAPYILTADNETGTATGLTPDVVNGIIDRLNLGITADFRVYSTLTEMEAALRNGEINVIVPFYPDYNVAQEHGLVISKAFRVSNMELVYLKGTSYAEALTRVATPATRLGIYYVRDNYAQSDVLGASGIQDAVDKVHSGEALGAVAQNVMMHNVLAKYDDLSYAMLPEGCGTCFAALPEDYLLIRILNRGLNYFSAAEISSIASQYDPEPNVTTLAYLSTHREAVIMLAVIFVILIGLAAALIQVSRLKKKADEANKSKTSFLFNMSHDIRTPMNAIMGFTGMAVKQLGSAADDERITSSEKQKVMDCLEKTQKAGNMLLSLINSVLEVSRIESGHAVPEENPMDVLLSFAGIENTMLEMARTKDICLTFTFGDIRDRYVYADQTRCMRIFVNIISNAIKYTNPGGTVTVKCEQEETSASRALYRYTFTDNGIGMSEEFQKHVFEQFARENTATVSGVQGTGLGMTVVKSFTELLGGTVSVRSRQGEGTVFTVLLPFRRQEGKAYTDPVTGQVVTADENARNQPVMASFASKRVLLVEDNELNREIAADLLTERGLRVEEAGDGTEAVEMLRQKGPDWYDFILMDIQMPRMNGYEATRAIRAMYPDRHIPVIALSANAFAEDRAASLDAGMDEHIAKPINAVLLFGVLAKYV